MVVVIVVGGKWKKVEEGRRRWRGRRKVEEDGG